MELLQLKYFQRVAELQHMSKAAASLHISQPALSKTIRQLEQELGVSLFHRHGRSISLNEYGEYFLKYVNDALYALECGKEGLKEKVEPNQVIRLAILSGSHLLPEILTAFRKKHPTISFLLVQSQTEDFDLCITSNLSAFSPMTITPLLKEELYLGVPTSHPLSNQEFVSLLDFKNDGWITLSEGKDLRTLTNFYCHLAGFTPSIIFESDNPATVRGLICAGQGISLIPAQTWNMQSDNQVALLKIKEPTCVRTIGLVSPSQKYESLAVQTFKDFIIHYFQSC